MVANMLINEKSVCWWQYQPTLKSRPRLLCGFQKISSLIRIRNILERREKLMIWVRVMDGEGMKGMLKTTA